MGIFSWFRSRRISWSRSHVPSGNPGPQRPRRLVAQPGHDSRRSEQIKRAAAADVARVEEDDKYFDPQSPGDQEDDL
jgi:hypothetical protein